MSNFIVTDELYKARKTANAPSPRSVGKISCAQNDFALFQILCENDGKRCILNVGKSPALSYEIGLTRFRIAIDCPFEYTVYAEGYLPDENGIATADILWQSPVTYDGGAYAPALVKIEVPENATAGDYSISVNVYAATGVFDEIKVFTKEIRLHVYGYRMPSPQEYRCHLDLWQHNSNIARAYGVEPWSEEHFVRLEKVIATLADLGQKSITVLAADCPWRGWGCYLLKDHPATLFEYSPVQIKKSAEGVYTYDFSKLHRLIDLYFAYGINGDITVYGLMGIWTNMPLFPASCPADHPEKVLVRYFDESDGCYRYMKDTKEITAYIDALFRFFRDTGVFELVRIGADEPSDCNAYERNATLLRSIAPDIRFKMALDKDAAIERFAAQTADVAASFPCSCRSGELLRTVKKQHPEKRILWYVCNIPDKPNTVLHSELLETRALGAIGYLFGFDGFLRWAYTCWTEKPLEDIRYNNTALPAGDVNFIYPAKDGSLLYSVRYFALKKALQDYELLLRLKEKGFTEQADNAVKSVLRNNDPVSYMKDDVHTSENIYSADSADYEAFRDLILSTLEREET